MSDRLRTEFAVHLGEELVSLALIKENKYCVIYRGETGGGPVIIKKYKGDDPRLAGTEAEALRAYHVLAEENPHLIDSGIPVFNERANLLRIGFVEGDPMSEVLYRARNDARLQERCVGLMRVLGGALKTIRRRSQRPGEAPSPFVFEYLDHCSTTLERLPIIGPALFSGASREARDLADAFRRSADVPSFAHGDLVFKNIHVTEDRVGLIDFGNANPLSHTLNDVYNLLFALYNMWLPTSFKVRLREGFREGLAGLEFPEEAHRFYYEYHRRRWLMLKFHWGNAREKIEGFRGLVAFARPFSPRAMFP
jgi:predicted Ser/Thr protein kinase